MEAKQDLQKPVKIGLKKEISAYYFNMAFSNLCAIDNVIDNKEDQIRSPNKKHAKAILEKIFKDNPNLLHKTEGFVFNNKDIAHNPQNEIETLILKLVDLRNYYSHYVHKDQVKILSKGEKRYLETYYEIAIEATGSREVALDLVEGDQLTDAGVVFFLNLFLKKSQANKLISSLIGFKRNDRFGQPRRNLFTYYSVREGYKVITKMERHFLLFILADHLVNQDKNIETIQNPDEISNGAFFHRIASTFLNKSGILDQLEFYTYQSNRLLEQRGELKPKEGEFTWIEPFQGNSSFRLGEHEGVMGEDQLKELCYALLVETKGIREVEGKIRQFLEKFKTIDTLQDAKKDEMMKVEYFPAHYFQNKANQSLKEKILSRLTPAEDHKTKEPLKAYDKMREVLEYMNSCLPAEDKMKQKDYRRYLKMVRFWSREKEDIQREFEKKDWKLPGNFWNKANLEDAWKYAQEENKKLRESLVEKIQGMPEEDFMKYERIKQAEDLQSLRGACAEYGLKWEEKDWEEYSRQVKQPISDRRKLTIMRQRATAALKKQQGLENLNLRTSTDTNKSRQAVLKRIALPRFFIKDHILQTQEKIFSSFRGISCFIELSEQYQQLSKQYFDNCDFDSLTRINGLWEKNKLIVFMLLYLMDQMGMKLGHSDKVNDFAKREVDYQISENVTIKIPLSQYPSLVYSINQKYVDRVDSYPFSENDAPPETILEKVKIIEEDREGFIKRILDFEKHLFVKKIIEKEKSTDVETHIGFREICDRLVQKGWDSGKMDKIRKARNKALHGDIPEVISFRQAWGLLHDLRKKHERQSIKER